jgi:hypothetical protein
VTWGGAFWLHRVAGGGTKVGHLALTSQPTGCTAVHSRPDVRRCMTVVCMLQFTPPCTCNEELSACRYACICHMLLGGVALMLTK